MQQYTDAVKVNRPVVMHNRILHYCIFMYCIMLHIPVVCAV